MMQASVKTIEVFVALELSLVGHHLCCFDFSMTSSFSMTSTNS